MLPVASPETTCWMKMSTRLYETRGHTPSCSPIPESQSLSVTQVSLADRVVPPQQLGRPPHHHPAGLHQEDVVREVERKRGVLLDQQDRDAGLGVYRAQDAED